MERLKSASNPNLLLLAYDAGSASVRDVCIIPKHFFVPEIVEQRKPLAASARRAGWVGSNILLSRVPTSGRIHIVQGGIVVPRENVLEQSRQTLFLRAQPAETRGWLIEVMKCVDIFGEREFGIEEIYAFEPMLAQLYPANHNIRPKIRQQLQVLRDSGYLEFLARGRYRRIQPKILS